MLRYLFWSFTFEIGVFGVFRIGVGIRSRQVNIGI
ncbi:Uncharacterised protein [Shigella sonnei]|nr:Uncharacterised protein [Shigella sonnei]